MYSFIPEKKQKTLTRELLHFDLQPNVGLITINKEWIQTFEVECVCFYVQIKQLIRSDVR